ncbi:hypothetical protein J0A67_20635 [Algoriphagus aestuariicola]|jgi:hypothetical protein|uniref:Addiction module component n=1 Tax=Algoriphagus aestuariicola TaxID=1852016 RepID=A0ABS3BY79_9BACT|nr:hypothetical protein [Algoriphagus aestuariicola]MBN7803295.1 hypothetical protein [Algoriphagus aestuariicola]
MDSCEKIKENLISRIRESNDLDLLQTLKSLVDSSEAGLFELSEDQAEAIEIGRGQIKNGKCSSHQQVVSDMKAWLSKK